jgi:zinc protease
MYELDNGLTVILAEDHDLPIVQVNVWYHVGSKDEVEGRTGFAHLFEHLMFQGSYNNNQDYFEPLQKIGASVNGTTNSDRTNYFEGVPADQLPLALWGEADRMGWLLPVLTEERLANQKDVVRNERRQRYENRPYGNAYLTLLKNTFPKGHPYHHSTIGSHEDLDAATLEDVVTFFETWYLPNNASLVIAGDFEPDVAKGLVEQYFGEIPRGEQPTQRTAEPVEKTEEVVIIQEEEGVPFHKVWMAWPSPALYADGDAELDILSSVLSDGKSSRLYAELVLDQQIAKDISAYQVSSKLSGMYMISATAAAGATTDQLVSEIDRIVSEVIATGPDANEVSVGITNYEAGFIRRLSSISAKADRLNSYFTLTGTPDYIQQDLQRYLDVTPQGVQETAAEVLGSPGRTILHIHPAEGGE